MFGVKESVLAAAAPSLLVLYDLIICSVLRYPQLSGKAQLRHSLLHFNMFKTTSLLKQKDASFLKTVAVCPDSDILLQTEDRDMPGLSETLSGQGSCKFQ
ncbi:hypothetical protein ILYODFUR_030062 [Ilyodon furcidens]|uniref:Uncharacterized protein n=1 Tax=Ilyodon furcidens TaxID=33524 RepID=A0ABV0VKV1_9TELE